MIIFCITKGGETILSIVNQVRRFTWNRLRGGRSRNGIIKLLKTLVYDLHVDECLKLSNSEWNKITLPTSIDPSECLPAAFPDLIVFAQMSNIVYKNLDADEVDLPPGWSLLVAASSGGYYGAAFIHKKNRQVLLAHRGTEMNSFWDLYSDVVGIWMNRYEPQMGAAMTFSTGIAAFCRENNYSLLFTGHSLGGWLAQITTFSVVHLQMCPVSKKFINREVVIGDVASIPPLPSGSMPYTVVFDSPGANEMLCKMRQDFYTTYGRMDVKVKTLPIEVYVSCPNAVNRVHHHVGTVYQVRVKTPCTGKLAMISINVRTHSMTGILEALQESSSGDVDKLSCVRELPYFAWHLVQEPNTSPKYKVSKYIATIFPLNRLQKAEQHFLQTLLTMRGIGQDIELFFQIPKLKEMMLDFQIENYSLVDTKNIHRFAFIPYVRWVVENHQEKFEAREINATAYSRRTKDFLGGLQCSTPVFDLKKDVLGIKSFMERQNCQFWCRKVSNTSVGIAEVHGSLRAGGMEPHVGGQKRGLNDNSYAIMDFHDFKAINNYLRFGNTGISLLVLECPNGVAQRTFSSWIEEEIKQKIILVTTEDLSLGGFEEKYKTGIHVTTGYHFTHDDLSDDWKHILSNKSIDGFHDPVDVLQEVKNIRTSFGSTFIHPSRVHKDDERYNWLSRRRALSIA